MLLRKATPSGFMLESTSHNEAMMTLLIKHATIVQNMKSMDSDGFIYLASVSPPAAPEMSMIIQ